jgi:Rrf2 family protein
MNISTKGRYGLRAIIDLARNYQDKPITLSAIAKRQQISEGYLEQLMASLKKAGLVKSTRGAQGGYVLAQDAQNITVGEIFRALEGELALTSCLNDEVSEACMMQDCCGSRFIWQEIQNSINTVLSLYTLADLLARENLPKEEQ